MGCRRGDLKLRLKTNQNRTIIYNQKVKVENGFYEFTVPYAHDCEECAVIPETPYQLKAGNVTEELFVSNEDVLNGKFMFSDHDFRK